MKKKFLKKATMLVVCLGAMCLVACGNNDTGGNNNNNNASTEPDTAGTAGAGTENGMGNDDTANEDTDANTSQNDNAAGKDSDANANGVTSNSNIGNTNGTNNTTVGTPNAAKANPINDKITGYYSETAAYGMLESELIDELDLETQNMSKTRYYYNYVDLNDDGTDEVVVELVGSTVSNSAGDLVCIVNQDMDDDNKDDDGFDIIQKFNCFANPIIVSDHKTKGWKDIIIMEQNKNDKTVYRKLVYDGKKYTDISKAETMSNIDDVTGVALLCNDIAGDSSNSNSSALYFAANK